VATYRKIRMTPVETSSPYALWEGYKFELAWLVETWTNPSAVARLVRYYEPWEAAFILWCVGFCGQMIYSDVTT